MISEGFKCVPSHYLLITHYITYVLSIGSDLSLWGKYAQLILGESLLELISVPTTERVRKVVTHEGRF